MTNLERGITRLTAEHDPRTCKPYVIRLEAGGRLVKVRVKGERTWYTVTVKQIVVMGANNLAGERRREKAALRAAKKAGAK